MPFIKGRYHINPVMGAALEAAREAEAALLELEQAAREGRRANGEDCEEDGTNGGNGTAVSPVHRIEIEAAGLVPSHSGRGEAGFVARVHRRAAETNSDALDSSDGKDYASPYRTGVSTAGAGSTAASPETHVFSNHGDLIDFLRDELAKSR